MVGGEEFIRAKSDISFNTVQDLAVYMYATKSGHKDCGEALSLTQEIYPELKTAYNPAIASARWPAVFANGMRRKSARRWSSISTSGSTS